ncbi:hypothetical protein [Deminuibacter soli]|uniref:Uncharacterized protein n=1 Tax=Deminuibacter soli TaxID=2291815 RepID=A0A3E1NQL4_9BACT|nr:hypothetical protein [Deminuibacter soli]RFM30216.1 hypothetical protein DXN05_04390 [Deminuibacter soli]
MKLKQILTLFCLLVLTTQMLPVRQIGRILSSSQMTEELPHDIGKDFAKSDPFGNDSFLVPGYTIESISGYHKRQFIHFDTELPAAHAGDIHCPPPNMA